MHTAGIYSDMTIDGPEIGDLVIILDKAKNLPNRKTIGKQDPYCAARLGKEAKKTDTDRRGGQTPKWDQELRFTVHDSPDYYQLKVSVFNDDKKTDLIGETWVSLENVIVRGGGRADGWHNLNCKGRYAGEIRVELTYYDIRAKEEKPAGPRRDSPRESQGRDTLAGPRQLKQAKRRPLPADPTDTTQAPSAPIAADRVVPPQYAHTPPQENTYPPEYQQAPHHGPATYNGSPQRYPHGYRVREPSQEPEVQHHHGLVATTAMTLAPHDPHPAPYDFDEAAGGRGYAPSNVLERYGSLPEDDPFAQPQYDETAPPPAFEPPEHYALPPAGPPPPPAHSGRHASPGFEAAQAAQASTAAHHLPQAQAAPYTSLAHPIPPSYSPQGQQQAYTERDPAFSGSSPNRSVAYQHDQWQRGSHDVGRASGRADLQSAVLDEDVPPPPPTHRSGTSQVSLYDGAGQSGYDPVLSPAPLNVSSRKGSVSPVPLSLSRHGMSASPSSYDAYPQQPSTYAPSIAPSSAPGHQHAATSPSRTSNDHPRRRSGEPRQLSCRDDPFGLPPSLVPGYDPAVAAEVSSRMMTEDRAGRTDRRDMIPAESSTAPPSYFRTSRSQQDLPSMHQVAAQDGGARRAHRSSVPLTKPMAGSAQARHTMRKSVSPQPSVASGSTGLSGVPFSPDAYDALNPNASPASSIDPRSPHHATEQGSQSSRSFAEDPIRGFDGRVIDPSDHLPSDTWAPEPDRSPSHSTPGRPETRSRPSPNGAQPMPPSARRPARDAAVRPLSVNTPTYISGSDAPGGNGALRNRLQKKSRSQTSSPGIAGSSPIGAYGGGNGTPRSLPRAPTGEYPLRERENYGPATSATSATGSPLGIAARGSPAGPPSLPPKVPMRTGREDYSALSEELRSIDIGGGGTRRVARRSQH
ncbi:MAG: hypothetical protein M1832_004762 [Thelocarpon impressellum]|nr:MAG: hypothetical protein M1832_004762 [Thelocarpon impressellum]